MKLLRYYYQGEISYGVLDGEDIKVIDGDIFGDWSVGTQRIPFNKAEILTPVQPSKILAVGLNYRDHAVEFGEPIPEEPKIFIKPATAALAHGKNIVLPKQSQRVDFEAELAVVIKKEARHVSEEQADAYILGYTCLNDVTARDLQKKDGQWIRAKGFDTFAPFGPTIETEINPDHLDIQLIQNGVVRQHSNTRHFIFNVRQLVSFLSGIMTLLPGDVITTGTPSGVGPVLPGDSISVIIEGVGTLTNGAENVAQ